MITYLLVNFGGPRSLDEVEPFLISLLSDQDVVRTNFPRWLHRFIFKRVAKKRAKKVRGDYEAIGGKSPIYEETEKVAERIALRLGQPVLTFHRYLTSTHTSFLEALRQDNSEEIRIFPLFPQFSYATTGSCARFFSEHLPWDIVRKFKWIPSYPAHEGFIQPFVKLINETLKKEKIEEKDAFLFFSAHGIPTKFVASGDLYLDECQRSYKELTRHFPQIPSLLAFQSQFGPEEWIRPYTKELVEDPEKWLEGRKKVLFVPLSFTSDHIETLHEIETTYLPPLVAKGIEAFRVPALGLDPEWIEGCLKIIDSSHLVNNQMLIRRAGCPSRCPTCARVCGK